MENQLNSGKFPFSVDQKVVGCPENRSNNELGCCKELIENLACENLLLKEENKILRKQVDHYKNSLNLNSHNIIDQGGLSLRNDGETEELKLLSENISKIQFIDEISEKSFKTQESNTELNIDEIIKQKELDLERKFKEEVERYKEEIWILKWHLQNSQITGFSGKLHNSSLQGPESSEG